MSTEKLHKVSRPSILMITSGFYPKVGGAERQAEQLARALQDQGFIVRIVTLQFLDDLPLEEELDGLSVVRIHYPRIKLLGGAMILLRLAWWLIRYRHDYEVIHVHMVEYLAFVASIVGTLLGKPVLLKFALRPPDSAASFGDFPKMVGRWRCLEWLLMTGIRKADRFVAISQKIEEMAVKQGLPTERVVRIPNGVDLQTFAPLLDLERVSLRSLLEMCTDPAVVYSGRLVPQKGVGDLLMAWQTVIAKRPDATLYILGTGRSKEELFRQSNTFGLGNSVQFLGVVDNIRDYLQTADMFVLPSHYEGMPNALLEAMSCGLPVVATAVSGVIDVIQDGKNGLLVEPGKPDQLAQAIIRLLGDQGTAHRLSVEARKTIEQSYSIEAVALTYAALYYQLLKEKDSHTKAR